MTNYSSRFIPDYTTKTEPLYKLTHKDQSRCWTEEHDHTVSQLKQALVSAPVTATVIQLRIQRYLLTQVR